MSSDDGYTEYTNWEVDVVPGRKAALKAEAEARWPRLMKRDVYVAAIADVFKHLNAVNKAEKELEQAPKRPKARENKADHYNQLAGRLKSALNANEGLLKAFQSLRDAQQRSRLNLKKGTREANASPGL
jgi:hypothetical protein